MTKINVDAPLEKVEVGEHLLLRLAPPEFKGRTDAWVEITDTVQVDGRYPGRWGYFEEEVWTPGDDVWVVDANGAGLAVGKYYRAHPSSVGGSPARVIFQTDRDTPRIGQITLTDDQSAWDLGDYDLVEVTVDEFAGPTTKTITGIAGGVQGRTIKIWFKPLASSTRYVDFVSGVDLDPGSNVVTPVKVSVAPNQGCLMTATYWGTPGWGGMWRLTSEVSFDASFDGTLGDLNGGGTYAGFAVMWGENGRALRRGGFHGGASYCGVSSLHSFYLSPRTISGGSLPGASETNYAFPTTGHAYFDTATIGDIVIHGLQWRQARIQLVTVRTYVGGSVTLKHDSASATGARIFCATGVDIVLAAGGWHMILLVHAGGSVGSEINYVFALPFGGLGGGGLADGDYGDITAGGGGTSLTIDDDTIDAANLQTDAVETAKIKDDNVTLAKINSGAGFTGTIP